MGWLTRLLARSMILKLALAGMVWLAVTIAAVEFFGLHSP
jgi:hypothetical protein